MRHFIQRTGALILVAVLAGCSPGTATNQPAGTVPAADAPETIVAPDVVHRAITLSVGGQMDVAVALLLDGTESEATAVAPLPCLSVSEAAFRQLSGAALDNVKRQNQDAADSARALARAAVDEILSARVAGEHEQADAWCRRVDAMGRELSKDSYNALLQLVGPSIIKTAARGGASVPQ